MLSKLSSALSHPAFFLCVITKQCSDSVVSKFTSFFCSCKHWRSRQSLEQTTLFLHFLFSTLFCELLLLLAPKLLAVFLTCESLWIKLSVKLTYVNVVVLNICRILPKHVHRVTLALHHIDDKALIKHLIEKCVGIVFTNYIITY